MKEVWMDRREEVNGDNYEPAAELEDGLPKKVADAPDTAAGDVDIVDAPPREVSLLIVWNLGWGSLSFFPIVRFVLVSIDTSYHSTKSYFVLELMYRVETAYHNM